MSHQSSDSRKETPGREGGCQCGRVRYRLQGEPITLSICHCTQCQRQSGSAFGMSLIVRKEDFQLSGGPLKTFTRTSDSGRSVTCAFCQDCGTRIFHQPQYLDGVVNVKPGTLDDTTALRPTMEVWTKEKQRWITWSLDVTSFEGQPI